MDPDPKPPFGTAGSAPCPSPGPLRLTTCGDSRRGPERTYDLSGPLLPLHSTIICRLLFSRMSRCFFQSQETASHFNSFIRALLFRKISEHNHSQWRIGRDSNPRGIAPKLISRCLVNHSDKIRRKFLSNSSSQIHSHTLLPIHLIVSLRMR